MFNHNDTPADVGEQPKMTGDFKIPCNVEIIQCANGDFKLLLPVPEEFLHQIMPGFDDEESEADDDWDDI